MGQILSILENYELERYTADSPEYLHLFTEAARRAYADRSEYLGDPDFTEDLTEHLLAENYIASRLASIDPAHASTSTEILSSSSSALILLRAFTFSVQYLLGDLP